MPAYNRVTQQFQNGFDLDQGDLNAFKADLKYWVLRQIAGLAPAPSGSVLASSTSILASSTAVLASAA